MTDVNETEAETVIDPSSIENEQDESNSEVVKPQESDGKDYKKLYENVKTALQAERQKRKEVPAVSVEKAAMQEPQEQTDEAYNRFLKVEATTYINNKLQTDPSFKDRIQEVTKYVEQGYTVDQADNLALADIARMVIQEATKGEPENKSLNQINTKAVVEEKTFKETGDHLKDFLNDPNVPEGAKEAAKRYF